MENIKEFKNRLKEILPPKQVYDQYIDRFAKGTDAGFYRLVPQMVVVVNNEEEVSGVLKICNELNIPVTFKAGGTSLSGQTITDSLLVEIGPDFTGYKINEDGSVAGFQPGLRGGFVNNQLAKYGKKIGPSPASISSAKIGGIVANNASGSSYGIVTNSYNVVKSLRLVMSDGTVLDTADDKSREDFRNSHAGMLKEISDIRKTIFDDKAIHDKIKAKYILKNTTGYGMNSFVDYEDPIDIISHLMVGSEGTLGFMSEITMETVDDLPYKISALVFFPDIAEASRAIMPLRKCKDVSAAELMDRHAMKAVEDEPGMPAVLKKLPDGAAALLIETSAVSEELLKEQTQEIIDKLSETKTLYPIEFKGSNTKDYEAYWKVRKGLFTSAAAQRPSGTSCIIEDVAFPGEVLDKSLPDLLGLIADHNYSAGSVMWGHLLDGNIHFLIMPDFSKDGEMDNYKSFMHKMASLVVDKYNGSLKAEHGTGRNMAPFVEYEWGKGVYNLMKDVKKALDPDNILNPGVLLNDDPEVYTKNIKPLPEVDELIDKCIECGFCEPTCPSRDFTLTPRQRISVYRELNRVKGEKVTDEVRKMTKDFNFKGVESCAADGLCALNCPVGINTGVLVKQLRFEQNSAQSNKVASYISRHFGTFSGIARSALGSVSVIRKIIPESVMLKGGFIAHKASGRAVPLYNKYMPQAAPVVDVSGEVAEEGPKMVYFTACVNRMFGKGPEYKKDEEPLPLVAKRLVNKAGYNIIHPENMGDLCCGMAFDSKGFKEQGMEKLKELEAALLKASNNGEYPVMCDMSPCLLRMRELMDKRLKLYEPVEFTLEYLKDKLEFEKQDETVMVHATCSTTKMGLDNHLVELTELCANEVIRPEKTGCCGWAGDKGFNLPELNASALRYLKDEVPERAVAGYSNSRTCEIGLSVHSGLSYKSILYLVDKATKPINR